MSRKLEETQLDLKSKEELIAALKEEENKRLY